MLEVLGIDCLELHHKAPCRGIFSLFQLMKAGKAEWHDDWPCRHVRSPASFRILHPHPVAAVSSKKKAQITLKKQKVSAVNGYETGKFDPADAVWHHHTKMACGGGRRLSEGERCKHPLEESLRGAAAPADRGPMGAPKHPAPKRWSDASIRGWMRWPAGVRLVFGWGERGGRLAVDVSLHVQGQVV
ncbi:hypothetical protein PAMP_003291 [Pampus punctatissimus]